MLLTLWKFDSNEIEIGWEGIRQLKYNSAEASAELRESIYRYVNNNNDYGYSLVDEAESVKDIVTWFPGLLKERLIELKIVGPNGETVGRGIEFFSPTEKELVHMIAALASIYIARVEEKTIKGYIRRKRINF